MGRLDGVASEWENAGRRNLDPLVPSVAPSVVMDEHVTLMAADNLSLVPLAHSISNINPGTHLIGPIFKRKRLGNRFFSNRLHSLNQLIDSVFVLLQHLH